MSNQTSDNKKCRIRIAFPSELLDQIDARLASLVGVTGVKADRQDWLIEAAREKLARDLEGRPSASAPWDIDSIHELWELALGTNPQSPRERFADWVAEVRSVVEGLLARRKAKRR